jgi:apolipoprotein N-acyltransferase
MAEPGVPGVVARAVAGLDGLAEGARSLAGWRRNVLATVLGAAASVALPPVHALPLLLVAFSGLMWQLEGARRGRSAFAVGWWFGFGHFAIGLYWIAHALLVDAARFGWMIPFAIGGLAAGFGIFTGLAGMAVRLARGRGVSGVLLLAIAWTAAEWLRGHVLTGFPWNLIGTSWAAIPAMMQPAALIGLYGLGLLTVAIAAMPATLARRGAGLSQRWIGTAAAAAVLATGWSYGSLRLAAAGDDVVPGVRLRLVQPDVPQSLKWDPALREQHFQQTLALSRAPGFEQRTHIIWPEAAVPFILAEDTPHRVALATAVPANGLVITGGLRVARPSGGVQVWNSLLAIDGGGAIVAAYDKFHLVPFGEYVPLRGVLPIEKITPGNVDFSAGPGPVTLALPGLPKASPLICYEIIFPAAVVSPTERPQWLLNVTNDAWFGISSGPYQHFAAARFRAVEEGMPLVRAANNGVSAIADSYGRITTSLDLGRSGVVDGDLPRAIAAPLYAQLGDLSPLALAVVLLIISLALRRLD